MKPRMKIFLRQKKVTTQLIAKSLANVAYDMYKPTFTVSLQLCEVYLLVSVLGFKAGTEKQKHFLSNSKVCVTVQILLQCTLRKYLLNISLCTSFIKNT